MKFEEGHYYKISLANNSYIAKQTIRTNKFFMLGPHVLLDSNMKPCGFESEYSVDNFYNVEKVKDTVFNKYMMELFEFIVKEICDVNNKVYLNKKCLCIRYGCRTFSIHHLDNLDNLSCDSINAEKFDNSDIKTPVQAIEECIKPLFKKLNDKYELCDDNYITHMIDMVYSMNNIKA
jgi:hypothetical protein